MDAHEIGGPFVIVYCVGACLVRRSAGTGGFDNRDTPSMDNNKRRHIESGRDRPVRLDHYLNRLIRSAGISESQAITLVHRFGNDSPAIDSAAARLGSFAKAN